MKRTAAAVAHPNIAFIKYWGNRDNALRLPSNGSVSMNLAALYTKTTVTFRNDLKADVLLVNGAQRSPAAEIRAAAFMDDLSDGVSVNDAVTAFCRNILDGAGV